MVLAVLIGAFLVCVGVLVVSTFVIDFRKHVVHEELVIAVVTEQIAKEQRHTDENLAVFDKRQRRIACMQRFERLATVGKVQLPDDLAARINAQLTIKGL